MLNKIDDTADDKKNNKEHKVERLKRIILDEQNQLLFNGHQNNNKQKSQPNNSQEKKKEVKNLNELLLRYIETGIQFLFKDQFGKLFANVKIDNDHYEIMSLTSKKFESYLIRLCYESEYKTIPNKELRNYIIDFLQYKAEFDGITKKLELRVAKTNDYTFYYDLTNNDGTVIKITSENWIIEKTPPILFRRFNNQLCQLNPSLTIEDKIFDKFTDLLNVKDDDNKLLLKCYIVSLFIPDIAKPILMLHGEQGSGKSTLQELIKMLVDPSIVKTLTFPRDINELIQQLSHNYIAYYDNISVIKEQNSDALCRAVTGTGFSKRQLYIVHQRFVP